MRDYTKIAAWQLADDLTVAIYRATKIFPREETCGITSQIRRAACSVPANIVEGSSRESQKDYLHFLYIARRSLSETQYFVHVSRRLGYLPETAAESLISQIPSVKAIFGGDGALRRPRPGGAVRECDLCRRTLPSPDAALGDGDAAARRPYHRNFQTGSQTKQTFACLYGLIKAVEKESGKFAKAAAILMSLLVISLSSRSPWSCSPIVP
jgi:four helix bundle protein